MKNTRKELVKLMLKDLKKAKKDKKKKKVAKKYMKMYAECVCIDETANIMSENEKKDITTSQTSTMDTEKVAEVVAEDTKTPINTEAKNQIDIVV